VLQGFLLVKIITNIFLSCDSVACIYLFLILINVWCLCLTNNALTICWWTWVNIGLISILTDARVTEQLLGADSTETPATPPTSTVEKPPSSTSSAEWVLQPFHFIECSSNSRLTPSCTSTFSSLVFLVFSYSVRMFLSFCNRILLCPRDETEGNIVPLNRSDLNYIPPCTSSDVVLPLCTVWWKSNKPLQGLYHISITKFL
jgi:hypothetical protein